MVSIVVKLSIPCPLLESELHRSHNMSGDYLELKATSIRLEKKQCRAGYLCLEGRTESGVEVLLGKTSQFPKCVVARVDL